MTEPLAQPVANPKWSRVGFWWRVLAALIDAAFLFTGAFIIAIVALIAMELLGYGELPDRAAEAGGTILALLYTLTEIIFAGTPGKRVLRMRIMHQDSTPADKWQLTLRWSTKYSPYIFGVLFDLTQYGGFKVVGGLCGLIVFIGCFFAANDDKLAWHDQWAKTAVYPVAKKQAQGFEVLPPETT